AVDRFLIQPVATARVEVRSAAERNRQLELDYQLVEHAQDNLLSVRQRSLPADPSVATILYQEWLMERVSDARLQEAVVTPGRPIIEKNVGHRIPFTVQASAELRHIGQFLDMFYETPILHRITFLSITNGGNSSASGRRLTVSLEALALEGAPMVDAIPAVDRSQMPPKPSLERYFSRRDPFRRFVVSESKTGVVPRPLAAKPAQEPKPRGDALKTTRLVASIWHKGRREAWFYDTRTEREFIVTVGQQLQVAEFSARVTDINSSSITLAHNQRSQVTQLGETLRESIGKDSP
ncbi:MAG: hypothetical protein ABGZ17_27330, partial [Planctomycetaceae bacterium]